MILNPVVAQWICAPLGNTGPGAPSPLQQLGDRSDIFSVKILNCWFNIMCAVNGPEGYLSLFIIFELSFVISL
jgi:hypothetical protein